jgi:hypothetical protein
VTAVSQPAVSQAQLLVARFKKLNCYVDYSAKERVAILKYFGANKDEGDLFLALDDEEALEMVEEVNVDV